ncbi:adenylate/guanylate cyclase domain-containing protein [Rhodococcus chondri]|uniref:Adenylate/guanylate cyclase domain-containing protein n=1 Tax=Rhodococcus chondri TaxID=3065941 RepID=A0ABU7JS81_9NOCA|nr:adenylate/guanylate cyclase domain-containing protein [Rhodococcus sp. CC-R104]MEE2032869.1 adenylate/guanylate cyclase domain-containing protein [Rhodococcus sp. CC-R104]
MPPPRRAAPLGSALLGGPAEPIRRLRVRIQVLLTLSLVGTHLVGALIAAVLINVVIPGPSVLSADYLIVTAVIAPVYVLSAVVFGAVVGTRHGLKRLRWALEDRTPTAAEQRVALRMPLRTTLQQGALWLGALVLFTTCFGLIEPETIPKVSLTIALAGVTVCGFVYQFSEFALRPVAARALEAGAPKRHRLAGTAGRVMLAWSLGSAVPVVGLLLVAVFSFIRPVTPTRLAVTILVLGGIALASGALLMFIAVRSSIAPIESVRFGMMRIEEGKLDTAVVVYDGTELGELQAGFNRMAEGLRERERMRDVFGRHVGREVAAAALANTEELGGEERDVAVLFIDIIGSTGIAESRPPAEVVNLLNRFFAVVVAEVHAAGGFVNKFEGDAALAIFGAPLAVDDAPGSALCAARTMAHRLRTEVPDCRAGIGVTAGRAVAGNIGAEERFEYTVIGDPVNEAARLSELAKTMPGHVVASSCAVQAASPDERARWSDDDEVVLRGRTEATRLAVPRAG